MIDINTALQNILRANYGRDVRQSIHDAIYQIDGNANEAVDIASIKFGTAVTGPTSPVGTYPNNTVYFNTSTGIIWKLSGGAWSQQGSMKAISSIAKTGTVGDTDTYTISYNDGTSTTYQVKNGTQGVSITNITAGTRIGNTQHYDINLSDGTTTPNGFDVVNGTNGSDGVSISDITLKTTVGSTKNYAVKLSDGTEAPTQFAVNDGVSNFVHIRYSASFDGSNMVSQPTKDHPYIGFCVTTTSVAPTDPTVYSWVKFIGDSGSGTGDMKKSDFVTTYPGTSIVDKAAALWDGSQEIQGTDMMQISDYASGGVAGTVDKAAQLVDTVNGRTADTAVLAKFSYSQGLKYDGIALGMGDMRKSVYASNGETGKVDYAIQASVATTANSASNLKKTDGTLVDANTITTKISKLDSDGKIDYSDVKNTPNLSNKIDKPSTASEGQVLTFDGANWVAEDSQGGGSAEDIEYDNTTSELEAENVQDAIDEISSELSTLNTYSTSTRIIGTWTDGSPIYRSTISKTFSTAVDMDDTNLGITKLIRVFGSASWKVGSNSATFPIGVLDGAKNGVTAIVSGSRLSVQAWSSTSTSRTACCYGYDVTVDYLK